MTRRASFRLDTKTGVGFNLARIQIQLPLATLEGNYVSAPDTWRIQPGSLKYPLIIAHRVCVELKARIAGMKELPQQVAQVIERHRRWDTTLVHSFNPVSLYYVRHASPEATVGFIWAWRHPYPLRARWLSPVANAHWSVPADATYNSRVLAHFHAQGKPVMAWDLDAGVDLEALGRSGLDAVVTDNPQRLIDQKPSRRPVAARA